MHLLRILFFFEARYKFHLAAQHIPGTYKGLADDISRNKHANFSQACLEVQSQLSQIPESLISLILLQEEWTSQCWHKRFNHCIG